MLPKVRFRVTHKIQELAERAPYFAEGDFDSRFEDFVEAALPSNLPNRSRISYVLTKGSYLTLEEMGNKFGVRGERVSQLEARGWFYLRRQLRLGRSLYDLLFEEEIRGILEGGSSAARPATPTEGYLSDKLAEIKGTLGGVEIGLNDPKYRKLFEWEIADILRKAPSDSTCPTPSEVYLAGKLANAQRIASDLERKVSLSH